MINKRSDHKGAFRRPTLHIVNMFKILNVIICKRPSGDQYIYCQYNVENFKYWKKYRE